MRYKHRSTHYVHFSKKTYFIHVQKKKEEELYQSQPYTAPRAHVAVVTTGNGQTPPMHRDLDRAEHPCALVSHAPTDKKSTGSHL